MLFKVSILGSNSSMPAHGRNQTSQLLEINNKYFLLDCGEGTQIRLADYKLKAQKINHIFISHLHGDHYFGLIGLISSMHLMGRTNELNIYGPPGLMEIIPIHLKFSNTVLRYSIKFHELKCSKPELIYEDKKITVTTIPLQHRIPCCGFLFREKPKTRRIKKDMVPADIALQEIAKLIIGEDILDAEGNVKLANEIYTLDPKKSRSYAFCSDTKFLQETIDAVKGVDLLYHEATFLNDEEERASKTFHSTAQQAATVGKKADVGLLLLGHFSSRYRDLTPILEEARAVFERCELAIEGETFELAE